jgi:hypothetical protein
MTTIATATMIATPSTQSTTHGGFGASSAGTTGEGFGWGAEVLEEPEGEGDNGCGGEEDPREGERGELVKVRKDCC